MVEDAILGVLLVLILTGIVIMVIPDHRAMDNPPTGPVTLVRPR